MWDSVLLLFINYYLMCVEIRRMKNEETLIKHNVEQFYAQQPQMNN